MPHAVLRLLRGLQHEHLNLTVRLPARSEVQLSERSSAGSLLPVALVNLHKRQLSYLKVSLQKYSYPSDVELFFV